MRKGFALPLIIFVLIVLVGLTAWSPWITEDYAFNKVASSRVKANCKLYTPPPVVYDFKTTFPADVRIINYKDYLDFGRSTSVSYYCPPDKTIIYEGYYVSFLGTTHKTATRHSSYKLEEKPKKEELLETADWKRYENKEGRYILRYPPDLTVFEETDTERLSSPTISTTYFNNNKVPGKGAFLIWIVVALKPEEQTSLEYWAESFKKDSNTGELTKYSERERLNIAQKFINESEKVLVGEEKIEGIKFISPDVLPVTTVTWFIKDKVYSLKYSLVDKSSGLSKEQKEKLSNQILSTFNFLD